MHQPCTGVGKDLVSARPHVFIVWAACEPKFLRGRLVAWMCMVWGSTAHGALVGMVPFKPGIFLAVLLVVCFGIVPGVSEILPRLRKSSWCASRLASAWVAVEMADAVVFFCLGSKVEWGILYL